MTLQIPAGGLVIPLDGKSPPTLTYHIYFDVCPTWLEIADRHSKEANERKVARVAAWNLTDEEAKRETLKREFEASMQAIMAAAVAIASFYANLRDPVNIPKEELAK